jgi:hypothetical protein
MCHASGHPEAPTPAGCGPPPRVPCGRRGRFLRIACFYYLANGSTGSLVTEAQPQAGAPRHRARDRTAAHSWPAVPAQNPRTRELTAPGLEQA